MREHIIEWIMLARVSVTLVRFSYPKLQIMQCWKKHMFLSMQFCPNFELQVESDPLLSGLGESKHQPVARPVFCC